jgi:hypothetical protein
MTAKRSWQARGPDASSYLRARQTGYSRLMEADEEGTHERLKAHLLKTRCSICGSATADPSPRTYCRKSRAFGLQRPQSISETDSALEEAGFELFVPLRITASPSWRSRARKPHARPRGFSVAGPLVRLHLPPAGSLQNAAKRLDTGKLTLRHGIGEGRQFSAVAVIPRVPETSCYGSN